MRFRRRCLTHGLVAVALVVRAALAAGDEGPGPSGDAPAVPARLAPAPLDLDSAAGGSLRERAKTRAEGSPWGWQAAAFVAALAATVAVLRGFGTARASACPSDAIAVVGAIPLGGQHALRVVRFGRRTLLVGLSPAGCQVLAETDEPLATLTVAPAASGPSSSNPPQASQATGLPAAAPAPPAGGARGAA